MAKFDKTAQIAMAGGAAIVAAIVGGVAIHRASVHNQNCLSYENQLSNRLDQGVSIINRLDSMMAQIRTNPFSAFILIGEVGKASTEADTYKHALNDLRYAYDNTCGVDRVNKFLDRKDVKDRVNYIEKVAASFQNI